MLSNSHLYTFSKSLMDKTVNKVSLTPFFPLLLVSKFLFTLLNIVFDDYDNSFINCFFRALKIQTKCKIKELKKALARNNLSGKTFVSLFKELYIIFIYIYMGNFGVKTPKQL